jgi:hypothetical protein
MSVTYFCVRARVCVCVCALGRVGICVCARASGFSYPAGKRMRRSILPSVASLAQQHFSTLSHKRRDFP